MIRFEDVGKRYDNEVQVLKKINLHVKEGELVALIGPSGCGKTTTMKMINRLIDPTSGRIILNGEDIMQKDPVLLRREIGYVIQQIGLLPHMTIEDNIALVPKLKKWAKEDYIKRVDELLDLVGLDPKSFKKRYPSELSGGQQQRIGVIRALAANPPIILMDEPFSALDPISREQLQDELIHLQKELHKTIVFVTHDMDEAIKIANRIAIMNEGEIVQIDFPQNILKHPKNDFVRNFIGSERLNKHQTQQQPLAEHLMVQKVVTSSAKISLIEAYDLMKNNNVDNLYIVDQWTQAFIGVISLEEVKKHHLLKDKTIHDVMQRELSKVQPDARIGDIAHLFSKQQLKALPVVQDGKLRGIITHTSLIDGLAEWERQREESV